MTDLDLQIETAFSQAKQKLAAAQLDFEAIDRALQHAGADADDDLRARHSHFAKVLDRAKAAFDAANGTRRRHREALDEARRATWLAEAVQLETRAKELREKALRARRPHPHRPGSRFGRRYASMGNLPHQARRRGSIRRTDKPQEIAASSLLPHPQLP